MLHKCFTPDHYLPHSFDTSLDFMNYSGQTLEGSGNQGSFRGMEKINLVVI